MHCFPGGAELGTLRSAAFVGLRICSGVSWFQLQSVGCTLMGILEPQGLSPELSPSFKGLGLSPGA